MDDYMINKWVSDQMSDPVELIQAFSGLDWSIAAWQTQNSRDLIYKNVLRVLLELFNGVLTFDS